MEAVLALERETADAPHWSLRAWLDIVEERGGNLEGQGGSVRKLFVAMDLARSGLLGFAVGSRISRPGRTETFPAELESVAVSKAARRRGIGRELCRAVLDWAHAAGAPAVELEVRSNNEGGIRLYNSLGFVEIGRRKSYFRDPVDDAVLMRLLLNQRKLT